MEQQQRLTGTPTLEDEIHRATLRSLSSHRFGHRPGLKVCQAEGCDGTQLAGCVKTYLPAPLGPGEGSSPVTALTRVVRIVCVAFGVRRPTRP
jgi:hypothetical protein